MNDSLNSSLQLTLFGTCQVFRMNTLQQLGCLISVDSVQVLLALAGEQLARLVGAQ